MSEFWALLQGSKTYIGLVVTTILIGLQTSPISDKIPDSWDLPILLASLVVGALTGVAHRSAVAKVEESQVDLANILLRDVDEEVAEEVLKATTRRIKVTAAKKPKPKVKGKS